MKLRHVITFAYNSSQDPLVQGGFQQVLLHVADQQPDLRLHIITYEQAQYALTPEQEAAQRARWAAHHVTWYSLVWHSGSFMPIKKAYDLFLGFWLCLKLRVQVGARSIMSFGTLAGGLSLLIGKLLGMKLYNYQYEPHSEFMLDCQVWSANSFAYRSLHYLEGLLGRHSDILSTGTRHMVARLQAENSPAEVYLLPSCVNEDRFQYSAAGRAAVRTRYKLSADQPVLLYLGKFGGIYYEKEVAELYETLRAHLPADTHLLIVTPDDPAYVAGLFAAGGVPAAAYTVTRSPFAEVPDYISAADFGLVAVPPTPAQRFRSPIKVGEYLCCGLPYLTAVGVSEDDRVATEYNVGVVVQEFTAAEAARVAPQVAAFLAEADEPLRARCRQVGVAYRGLRQYLPVAEEIFAKL